jgi:putative hydrolase of the HAD superfamily
MTSSRPILVFDLDDTLYDELSYLRSGLRAVAAFAAAETGVDEGALLGLLEAALDEDRSGVFDRAFARTGVRSSRLVRRCVGVYRTHTPTLSLHPAAERCLDRFSDHRTFLVTDGNTTAQARKVAALGLEAKFEKVFLTWRYGHARSKPSPWCFEKIRALTGARPCDVIYVGDNPSKDFVGLRPLGYGTIRVLTGQHAGRAAAPGHDAELTLPDLDALTRDTVSALHGRLAAAHAEEPTP